jgi:hypothetical protein
MMYFIAKAVLSGILIALISEAARRWPGFGGLIASLPLVSILAIVWLWRDTSDPDLIARHARATLWYVLPSLPFFLVLPAMIERGQTFWVALGVSIILTIALYGLALWAAGLVGLRQP